MSASSSACFPLTGTTTCTMFSDVKVHPFANVFRDVPSFDKYIRDSFPTSPVYMNYFQQNYTCPSWDGTGLRFPVSFICGLIVDVSTTQFNCNEPAQVKNICKSTALQTLSSYRSAFSNPELCTPGGQRAIPQRYLSFVNGLAVDTPGSGSCFPGMAQEIRNCGFVTSQEKTEYCLDNVTDRCCTGSPEGITASGSADSSSGATNSTVTVSGTNVTATATGTATAAAAANQAKGEDGSSNSTIPLIVGGIIGGLVLLGLIIGILTYLRKKRAANGTVGTGFGGGASGSAPSGKLMGGSNSPEVMRVVYDYVPNLFDEIHLYAGDQIEVKAKFDDGWAYGLNLTSKKEGSFPLACVESLSGIKGASSVASSPSKNNIRQRASSLYVGKQY